MIDGANARAQLFERGGDLIADADDVADAEVGDGLDVDYFERRFRGFHHLAALDVGIFDFLVAGGELLAWCGRRSGYSTKAVLADLDTGRRGDFESSRQRLIFVGEVDGHARRCGLPTLRYLQRDIDLGGALGSVSDGDMHLADEGFGGNGGGCRSGNHHEGGIGRNGERGHYRQLHALVTEEGVFHVPILHRYFPRDGEVAGLNVEGDAEWRGSERHTERDRAIEDLDGLIIGMLPVVVVEVGSGGLGVLGDVRVHGAGEGGFFFEGRGSAQAWRIETGDGDARDGDIGWPAVLRGDGELDGLAGDNEAVIGDGIEGEAVRHEEGVFKIGFFDFEAELDLIAGGIGKIHGVELRAQATNGGKARFDGCDGAGIVAGREGALREFRIVENGGKSGGQFLRRLWRVFGGGGDAGVDAVDQRFLRLVLFAGDGGFHELVAAATAAAAAGHGKARNHAAHALALVEAARVGADLLVSAAEERIISGSVDGRQLDGGCRGRAVGCGCGLGLRGWCGWRATASAAAPASAGCCSGRSRAAGPAEPSGEVELPRLPSSQAFFDLLGIPGRIARREEALAHQDGGSFVGAVAAAALNVHGDDDVGPERPDEADIVADDVLAAPLGDDFFGIKGVAVVDGAREVLLGTIDAVGREQFGSAEHGDIAEQLGADFVLAAVAAVVLDIDHSQSHAVAEQSEQGVGFVVGVRGRLHEGAGDAQLAQRETERDVTALLGDDGVAHAVLRLEAGCSGDAGDRGEGDESCYGRYNGERWFHSVPRTNWYIAMVRQAQGGRRDGSRGKIGSKRASGIASLKMA